MEHSGSEARAGGCEQPVQLVGAVDGVIQPGGPCNSGPVVVGADGMHDRPAEPEFAQNPVATKAMLREIVLRGCDVDIVQQPGGAPFVLVFTCRRGQLTHDRLNGQRVVEMFLLLHLGAKGIPGLDTGSVRGRLGDLGRWHQEAEYGCEMGESAGDGPSGAHDMGVECGVSGRAKGYAEPWCCAKRRERFDSLVSLWVSRSGESRLSSASWGVEGNRGNESERCGRLGGYCAGGVEVPGSQAERTGLGAGSDISGTFPSS